MGPTKSLSPLWKMAAKRVGPAPQASNTMSASFSPVCGRAPRSLLTFTTTATRDSSASSVSGSPVSGCTGPGMVVVVGGMVVVLVVLDDEVVGSSVVLVDSAVVSTDLADDPLHAASTAAPPARANNWRRETSALMPEGVRGVGSMGFNLGRGRAPRSDAP